MHFEGLDLNLLVALDALLTEQSVTRAASRLCVTQPAVSVALQKLRVQFSDQLLERVGRRMELTPLRRSWRCR
jgi:DNA-binding transcriptional LysR family regulator